MTPELSIFGKRLAVDSGIGELMKDLGEALASGDPQICMLGGGQPSRIDAMDQIWLQRWNEIGSDPDLTMSIVGEYQAPAGNQRFREAVAKLFRDEYGWPITAENVAVTAGGQTAFFLLLNSLAGVQSDGTEKKILLPIVPEYVGYADQSTSSELFKAVRPTIQKIGDHRFKYVVDFDALEIDDSIAAICLSRPTNPSANVIGDDELQHLADLAQTHQIPLIVDNAYGDPFPGVIFTETHPVWKPSMVMTYSLSKLGLPGTRTGIVIADPKMIEYFESMNAITALANNNLGQALVQPLIESKEILTLSRDVIRPYYHRRAEQAIEWISEAIDDAIPYRIHVSEGAFFVWLWLENLPVTSSELYERLKQRGVLVISGHYFFFGLDDSDWPHPHQCLRISFTAPDEMLKRGLETLGEEINLLYAGHCVTSAHE